MISQLKQNLGKFFLNSHRQLGSITFFNKARYRYLYRLQEAPLQQAMNELKNSLFL